MDRSIATSRLKTLTAKLDTVPEIMHQHAYWAYGACRHAVAIPEFQDLGLTRDVFTRGLRYQDHTDLAAATCAFFEVSAAEAVALKITPVHGRNENARTSRAEVVERAHAFVTELGVKPMRLPVQRPDYCNNGKYQFATGYTGGGAERCVHLSATEIADRMTAKHGPGALVDDGVDLWWDQPEVANNRPYYEVGL